jgi:tetratricopeptide (TPR) repeat protein
VLLGADGRPRLLDFNLSADGRYDTARLGGTLPYMAPEQVQALQSAGPAAEPDGRADLFSLGVILYELLTGRHPFGPVPLKLPPPELGAWLLTRQRDGFRPLRSANPAVGRAAARVVEQCLAFDPAGRPAGAAELAAAIRRTFVRRARWRRWAPVAVAAGLSLCLAGAAGAWLSRPGKPAAEALRAEADRAYQRGKAAYEDKEYGNALEAFNLALEANPDHAPSLFGRGCVRLRQGKWQDAKEDFTRAERLRPDGPTQAALGCCYSMLPRERRMAMECYDKAKEAGYKHPALYNNRAYHYLAVPEFKKAADDLEEALRLAPDLRAAHYNRALLVLFDRQNHNPARLKQAVEDIDQVLATERPVSATLYRNAAAVYALTCGQELRAYATYALELAVPVGLLCDEKRVELTGAPRWIVLREKAVDLLRKGVSFGLDTSRLEKDRVFWILKSDPNYGHLANLANQKSEPAASDPAELRLVPLLPDLSD